MRKFAVIGLGRFGMRLATELSGSGAEVIAIDVKREEIESIRDKVTMAVRLDSADEEALKSQGIQNVDVAIVGIGEGRGGFEAAILTVVNLKNLGVKHIYARAISRVSGQVFKAVGATEIVYPEIEAAERWACKLVTPQISETINIAPNYKIARLKAPESFVGKTIADLQLRQRFNVNVVLISRGPNAGDEPQDKICTPMPLTVIYSGDTLILGGLESEISKLPQQ
ncbi:MAG: TrkA family potassium uptake protein [Phycisphaerae bacterium]|jgi:trk system potassium uptake protein TrkA